MPKIMEIIEKETKGKSYHTYKYSYDSIGLPSIDYDDDPNKVMKWKDSGETGSPKKPIDLKPLADQLQSVGEKPLLKYFLDGSRHVFKVDDIAYNKQVFPVVAGQIGIGCCKRENKRMSKERFYRELVLALPDKANADGWDDAAYFAAKVKKLNESEELKRLGLHFSAIIPYSTSKAGSPDTKLDNLAVGVIQDYMIEAEKRMVAELVKDKRLGQDAYLLKDGSLEYKVMKSGREDLRTLQKIQLCSKADLRWCRYSLLPSICRQPSSSHPGLCRQYRHIHPCRPLRGSRPSSYIRNSCRQSLRYNNRAYRAYLLPPAPLPAEA